MKENKLRSRFFNSLYINRDSFSPLFNSNNNDWGNSATKCRGVGGGGGGNQKKQNDCAVKFGEYQTCSNLRKKHAI